MPNSTNECGKVPPGPRGSLVLGSTFAYLRDQLGFLSRAVREHGDIVRAAAGEHDDLCARQPRTYRLCLAIARRQFHEGYADEMADSATRRGTLDQRGGVLAAAAEAAQPAFQRKEIERYAAVMVEHTEHMLESWHDGQVKDPHEDLMHLTLSIVAKTLFDAELGGDASLVGESIEVVMNYFMSPMRWFGIREWLPLPSTRRYHRAIKQIDDIIYGIIRQRRESGQDPGDLLSRLLAAQDEDGSGMTDRQLRDECVTVMLAGHETTALVLFYTFYLLAKSPEAEDRLAERATRGAW